MTFDLGGGYAIGESPRADKPGKPLKSVICCTICILAAGHWELGFT